MCQIFTESKDGFFHWGKVDLAFHEGARRKALQEQFAKKSLRFFEHFDLLRLKIPPPKVHGQNLSEEVFFFGMLKPKLLSHLNE